MGGIDVEQIYPIRSLRSTAVFFSAAIGNPESGMYCARHYHSRIYVIGYVPNYGAPNAAINLLRVRRIGSV